MQGLNRARIMLAVLLAVVGSVQADAPTALKYVDEAKSLVGMQDYDGAQKKLELAEAELDGVDAAAKAGVQKGIAEVKKQIADAQLAGDRRKYTRALDRALGDAEGAIGNLVTWPGAAARFNELANDPAAKAALGDALTAAQGKFATFQKLHTKKASAELGAQLEENMKTFETEWAENKAKLASGDEYNAQQAARSTEELVARLTRQMEGIPADDPKVVAAKARFAAVTKEIATLNAGAGAQKLVDQLKRSVESYSNEWQGWESETAAPTWEEYKSMSGGDIDRFKSPKSIELWHRAESILKDIKDREDYKTYGSTPPVKAEVDKLQATQEKAYKQVLKNVTAVVEGAEKSTLDKRAYETFGRLNGSISYALRETPDSLALIARVSALTKKYDDQVLGAEKANAETLAKLTAEAEKAWPGMVGKISAKDGFDPATAKAGEYYRIKDGANRMGWDFRPENGGFDFAMKVNGQPVAGNYDPAVRAAKDEVKKKTGREIDDSGWDFVVLYEGKQGKLQQLNEGTVKTTGGEEIGTIRAAQTVDAPIVKIVALHVGPLAVAQGQGAVTESGAIAVPVGAATGAGGSGWMSRIFFLLVGLSAAFICLVKARFAPLASVSQVGQVQTSVGDKNLSFIGLALGALGAIWLLTSLYPFSFFAVLASLATMAAGIYAGLDFLTSSNLVKPDVEAKIRPLGVPIGLACAALVLVSLFQ